MMKEDYEYKYHECNGLEFLLVTEDGDEFLFDVDYNGEFLLLDLFDEIGVEI